MRIVIIADPLDKQYAGIYQYTRGLTEALGKFRSHHEILVVRLSAGETIPGTQTVVVKNVLPFLKNDPFRTFCRLPRRLNKLKPDVVIEPAHFGPFNLDSGIKRVTVIHDLVPFNHPEYAQFLSSLLQRLFVPGVLRRSNIILTNSEYTRSELLNKFPALKEKAHVLYPGTDLSFKRSEQPEELSKMGIHCPYFLFTGTIEPRKNLETLLQAYQLVRSESNGAKCQLVIAGKSGWKNKRFFDALHNHPFKEDIIITGYFKKQLLPALYSSATALVVPSFTEGFGIPVLEAWACETPCILAKSGALPEVAGDAALYFSPDDTELLAQHMKSILQSDGPSKTLIEYGKSRLQKFSREKSAALLEQILMSQ
jgi:glycosyltransferase involved in cell wall biosynthesis